MKILFATANCLLDPSSGASISCRSILEGLAERGHRVTAFSATIFDRPQFSTPDEFLQHIGARGLGKSLGKGSKLRGLNQNSINYLILPTRAQRRMHVTCSEEMQHQATFKKLVEQMRPDIVMAYGGRILDRDNFRWLKDKNIPVVFYLANPSYRSADTFRDVSLVITDSQATSDLYRDRLGINVRALGKVISPVSIDPEVKRNCVTFVNPAPQKGSTIFVAVAQEAQRRGLSVQFLVVESRDKLARTLKALGLSAGDLPNVTCLPLQDDLNQVWSRTQILLSPSLWHESGSRTIVEACSAGIPVIATDSGGTPELLGDAGFIFPRPTKEEKEYLNPISNETANEWTDVLEKLLNNEAFYKQASELGRARWNELSQRDPVAKLEKCLKGLLAGKRTAIGA